MTQDQQITLIKYIKAGLDKPFILLFPYDSAGNTIMLCSDVDACSVQRILSQCSEKFAPNKATKL